MDALHGIQQLVTVPAPIGEVARVVVQQEVLREFLREQRDGDWTLLYGWAYNRGSVIFKTFIAYDEDIDEVSPEDFTHWDDFHSHWSCGLTWGGDQPPRVELNEGHLRFGPKELENAESLIVHRSFEGRRVDPHYFVLLDEIALAHEIHWVPERQAWCRFDEAGDIEDVARIRRHGRAGQPGEAVIVEMQREVLNMHMAASDSSLLQVFDSSIFCGDFSHWDHSIETEQVTIADENLYYRRHIEKTQSWARGAQIIRSPMDQYEFGAYLRAQHQAPKEYESFLTHDWKNGRLVEVSSNPDALASYFEKDSDRPYQVSPAFFNAAVLDRYKASPEKYTLAHRSLTCRGGWGLKTYDINEAGQVHTYICYLGNLPIEEQRYWKAFNEPPRQGISRRAFKTDYEGKFDDEPDYLRDLLAQVEALHRDQVPWFTLREPDLPRQVHYPHTGSDKAWGDTLSTLAKVVNEGLVQGYFEKDARAAGAPEEPRWRSIRWMRESLTRRGVDAQIVADVVNPFADLQTLRTKFDAHSNGDEAATMRESLLREFGTAAKHVAALSGRLSAALATLRKLLN